MRNLKGSLPLLMARQNQLECDIKELTKNIDNSKSMSESTPFLNIRFRASQKLGAVKVEISRVKKEIKRLEGSYSNTKQSSKPVTVILKGKK